MLHIQLKVVEVREVREEPDGHILVYCLVEAKRDKPETKQRIVQLGPMRNDEDITRDLKQQITTIVQNLPCRRPTPESAVTMFLTTQQFIFLGKPTVGDYIQLNARTLR